MKILGVGLSKTGTTSLHHALEILGFNCLHYDRRRLNEVLYGTTAHPNFRVYDDIDAVTDLPSAYFYRELLEAYPDSKAILTLRRTDDWWNSIKYHTNTRFPISETGSLKEKLSSRLGLDNWIWSEDEHNLFRRKLRNCVYGSTIATEFLYKKKYNEHNERVISEIPSHRLLVLDITTGDGWEKLCPFLEIKTPSTPFPHAFKTPKANQPNQPI